jgi:chaperonin GroEL
MKIVKRGQEARDALKRGIDLACDCAKATIGPGGRNAVLGRIDLPPTITNDGVSVIRNIEAEDEIENQGVWIAKEACSVASGKAGDGTTTTAVLLQAIIGKCFDMLKDDGSLVSSKPNVTELMRQVNKAKEEIVAELEKEAKPVTESQIFDVAKSAGELDWIASIVTEMYSKIGKDGHVTLKEGVRTRYETFKGIELNAGYPSEYFITNDNQEAVIENPRILVTNQALDTNCVVDIITKLSEAKSNGLVLIAPDFSRDMISRLNTTKLKAGFSAISVKLPTFGNDDILMDVATLTGAKFLDRNLYTKTEDFIKAITVEALGTSDSAIIGQAKTTIIGGNGDTTERVKVIRQKMAETLSLFDKDALEKRLAYLSGGIATLYIGGASDFEKGYLKLKAENAVASVQRALEKGVVKGGGLALKEIGDRLVDNVLSDCVKEPYNQIQENAGGIEIGDNVIDAVAVTISSLESACSLASVALTTEVVTAFKNKKDDRQD